MYAQSDTTVKRSRPGASGVVLDGVERWTGLALGLLEVVTSYSQATLAGAEAEAQPSSSGRNADAAATGPLLAADVLKVLPGACAALALRLQSAAFDAVSAGEAQVARWLDRLGAVQITSPLAARLQGVLAELDAEFKAAQAERAVVASSFLAEAGPRTLDELLARIDMAALLERVDLDEVIEGVDIDRVVARVDVNDMMSGAIQDIQVTGLLRDGTGVIATSTVGALRTQIEGVARTLGRGSAGNGGEA
ncbi:MAG: hypothetical protein ACH36H_05735 [Candidatus Nanopelagicales bacterium]